MRAAALSARARVEPLRIQKGFNLVHGQRKKLCPQPGCASRQIVLGALQDTDEAVRAFTVNALGSYGGKDMVTALRKVAETDPSPEVDGSSIRKAAAEAIAAIQKRAVAASPTMTPH
jgi:hypothetical protein